MDVVRQYIHNGYRSLRSAPGFALTAILTLALGIGLSTAVFTVADGLLLRQLPVREQDRIVALWGQPRDRSISAFPLRYSSAGDFARRSRALAAVARVAFEGAWPVTMRDGDRMSRLRRALVTGNFFDVLGARPEIGRALNVDDDVVGAAPVVVLSHATWRRWYGGDPSVIGRSLTMHDNGTRYRIIGVMPDGLEYPRGTEFWAALVPARSTPRDSNTAQHSKGIDSIPADVNIIGRLARGATANDARAELSAFLARADATRREHSLEAQVHTLPDLVFGDTKPAVLTFVAAAALLLLIACINVANLLLVRGIARAHEVAVRTALGARRRQIVAQFLSESALLAIAGGALGILVASAVVRLFVRLAPAAIARVDQVALNAQALAAALAITTLAMLCFALAPAILGSRAEPQRLLRAGARNVAGRQSRRSTEWLVMGQVALAVIVLSACGLIGRSLLNLERAPLSLDPEALWIGDLAVRYDQYDNVAKQNIMLERIMAAVRSVPGVIAVSPVVAVPFSGRGGWDGQPSTPQQSAEDAAKNPMVNMEVVTPDYFKALRVPVMHGRAFSDDDRNGTTPVIMVSESAARHFWPDGSAIGKQMLMGPEHVLTVIGVVPDTRYRDLRDARPSIYFPFTQSFFPFAPMTLAIRTNASRASPVPRLRAVIEESAPGVTLASAAPFDSYLEAPLAEPRLNAMLLALFALSAVALAAVGLYGVMATMVRQRSREMGVRLALGATAQMLSGMVMRRGLVIASTGVVLGLAGAQLMHELLEPMLYGVGRLDVMTLAVTVFALLIVALAASVIPARMSARIDPATALRAEA